MSHAYIMILEKSSCVSLWPCERQGSDHEGHLHECHPHEGCHHEGHCHHDGGCHQILCPLLDLASVVLILMPVLILILMPFQILMAEKYGR